MAEEKTKEKGPRLKAVTISYHDADTVVLPSNEYANVSTFQGYTVFMNRGGEIDKKLNDNKVMLLVSGNNQAMIKDLVMMFSQLVSQMINVNNVPPQPGENGQEEIKDEE